MLDDLGILRQPTMTGDFEKVGSLSWVRNQYAAEKITSVRCDVLGKGEGGRDYVFVQEVNVVSLWVGRVVVEGQVTGKHRIL